MSAQLLLSRMHMFSTVLFSVHQILLLQCNWMALNARDSKKTIDGKKSPEMLEQAPDNRKQIMIFFPLLRFRPNSFVNPEI